MDNFIKLSFLILILALASSCNNKKETQMTNIHNDTTWYHIPVARIIYPFDSLYHYDSEYEKRDFLILQVDTEIKFKIAEREPYPDTTFLKCPTLSTENSYSNHILIEDYLTSIIYFKDPEEDMTYCEQIIGSLYENVMEIIKLNQNTPLIYPLDGRSENTQFRGYILSKDNYPSYARPYDFESLEKNADVAYLRTYSSKLRLNEETKKNTNILLVGLSRSFELNPDVIKVVELPLSEK